MKEDESKSRFYNKVITLTLICGGVTVLWLFLSGIGLFQGVDLKVFDFFMKNTTPPIQDTSIIVVEYDDQTAENLLQPFAYHHLAVLIDWINRRQPRVLALDLFSMKDLLRESDSIELWRDLVYRERNVLEGVGLSVPVRKSPIVRQASTFDQRLTRFLIKDHRFASNRYCYEAEQLFEGTAQGIEMAANIGHLVLSADPDGVYRRVPVAVLCGEGFLLNFGTQAALGYLGVTNQDISLDKKHLSVNLQSRWGSSAHFPLDKYGQMGIWFNDRRDHVREISILDVFQAMKDSLKEPGFSFKDKIVFVGNTSSRSGRFCATPLHPYYPTLLVHANAANNILQGRSVSFVGGMQFYLLIGGFFILFIISAAVIHSPASLLWLFLLIPASSIGAFMFFESFGLYVPVFMLSSYCGAMAFALFISSSITKLRALNRAQAALLVSIDNLEMSKAELDERVFQVTATLSDTRRELHEKDALARISDRNATAMHQIKNEIGILLLHVNNAHRRSDLMGTLRGLAERATSTYEYCEDMLRFMRSSSVKLNRSFFPLAQTIRICMDSYTHLMQEKKITVDMSSIDEALKIFADKDRMIDVFTNLIKNALEALPENGSVTISATLNVDSVVLVFSDTGPGIPDTKIASIFEPFFTFGKKKGTGLGLAIVKQFIELHGGKIAVESPSGRGARFTLWLPTGQTMELQTTGA